MRGWPLLLLSAFAVLATAQEHERAIKDLKSRPVEVHTDAQIVSSSAKAMENYRRFLELSKTDPQLRAEAMRRLGDLNLEAGELERMEHEVNQIDLQGGEAIKLYSTLLKAYPGYPRNDQVLYQLARAYETTRQMSVKDSLTDSFNHRYFQETLYRELTRHERSGQSLTLLMIDIDDFKKINDRWGHPVGDLVLRGLVEELLKGVREMDTVARYGGEEFAVILPETGPDKGYVVADRLRARVASRLFVSPELSHPLTVSISIGLATFPEDANAKRSLIERADQALYQAKRSGKNCVVTAASQTDLRVG